MKLRNKTTKELTDAEPREDGTLNAERLYHAETVNELTGGNGVLTTSIPITRENNK